MTGTWTKERIAENRPRAPLAGILPDLARGVGAGLEDLPTAGLPVGRPGRAIVVLVDGLGWEALRARSGHAPTLRRMLRDQPRDWPGFGVCGFPSTTAASLATFGTGLSSGTTGLLGYTVRDPRRPVVGGDDPSLVNLVGWSAGDHRESPRPEGWQPHSTVFQRIDLASVSIGRARFAGSGLTRAALRGSQFVAAESLSGAVDRAAEAIRSVPLVYLYWGELDHVGHRLGWTSAEWGEELAAFDSALAQLVRRMPRGTAIVVTADHGMVDRREVIDIASHPTLIGQVPLVAGDPRALHLYVDPDVDPVAVRNSWSGELGEQISALTRDEAMAAGLFGAVEAGNAELIGDVVVVVRDELMLVDSRTQSAAAQSLVGSHGSLTSAEMHIPILVAEA